MGKWLIIGLLLVVAAVGLTAFAQTGDDTSAASAPAADATPPQAIMHGDHLIVLHGTVLNVYDLSQLPEVKLVNAIEMPDNMDQASAVMAARGAAARVAEAKGSSGTPEGRKIYDSLECAKCHRIAGKGGTVGPDLSHEGSKRDQAWIEKKITDPKATKKDSIMPAHKLPKQQLAALGNYLACLK